MDPTHAAALILDSSAATVPSAAASPSTGIAASRAMHLPRWRRWAAPALRLAGAGWLAVAVVGQLLFATYVLLFYGGATLQGRPDRWNEVMPQGHVPGETFFNGVLGLHLLFVVVILLGGALQLVPRIRRTWPGFHRWTGRLYLLAAAVLAVGGLVLVWARGGTAGDLTQHLGITLNAVLILVFAGLAWRRARARQVAAHRRWALRLFLAVSGVWFFRIGLMLWLVVNQGPAGFDPETFSGPVLSILSFAQSLGPLAVLQLYFVACERGGAGVRLAMAGGLGIATLATAAGIAAATAIMWLPRL